MVIVFKICQILNHLLHEPKVNSNSRTRSLVLAQWLAGGGLDCLKNELRDRLCQLTHLQANPLPTNPKHSNHDPKFNPTTQFASYLHNSHSLIHPRLARWVPVQMCVSVKGQCIIHTASPAPPRPRDDRYQSVNVLHMNDDSNSDFCSS